VLVESTYTIEYKISIDDPDWQTAEDGLATLPDAKTKATQLSGQGHIVRIQRVTVEEHIVWTNASNFPPSMFKAIRGLEEPGRLGAGASEAESETVEVKEEVKE
jgi:hypothetical protein